MERLKTPPALNQFNNALNKNQATELFKLLNKYRPETKKEKKQRLKAQAASESAKSGSGVSSKPPPTLKCGLNHITYLVEKKKAKMDPEIAERAAVLASMKKQIALAKVNAQRAATIEAQKQIEKTE